jgi:1-acyl-sn-glycerol-3-phosphate acyltransferase
VLKKELYNVPFLHQIALCTKSFAMDREDVRQSLTVIQNVTEEVKNGRSYLIFPEGTRVKPGMVSEPKPGAVLFSVRGKVPLVPVYIPAGRKVFRKNVIVIGEPYHPAVDGKPDQQQYQDLTNKLMDKIHALKQKGEH